MDKIINELNCFFEKYTKIKIEEKKIKKRNRSNRIQILDALEYFFNYTDINSTQMTSKASTNIENKKTFSRSSYERLLDKIPITAFIKIYSDIVEIYKKHIDGNNKINKILNGYDAEIENLTTNFIAVDGVCSNEIKNNELFTNQNLGFLDLSLNIPIDFIENKEIYVFDNNKNNKSNKNHESVVFDKYINNQENNNKIKDKIYVNDRAYFKYKLVKKIMDNVNNNNSFIFRIKDNLDILDDSCSDGNCKRVKLETKSKKDFAIKNMIIDNPNIRILKYTTISKMTIYKRKKYIKTKKNKENKKVETKEKTKEETNNQNNDSLEVNTKSTCFLITNLPKDQYNDNAIKLLYSLRWNIEIYFKLVKNNFKFDTFYIEDKDKIKKLKYAEMIIFILNKLLYIACLEEQYKKNPKKFSKTIINKKTKEIKNVSIKINTSLSLKGFYKLLLHHIIRGTLTNNIMENYNSEYLIIIKNDLDRSFKRESLIPYSKWYIKKFHKAYELEKIITAIQNDTIDKLNKNLKLKANDIKKSLNENKETIQKLYSFIKKE